MKTKVSNWFKTGDPWIWLNAAAVTVSIIMVGGLLLLIASRGLVHFWPKPLLEAEYVEPGGQQVRVIGEIHDSETVPAERLRASGIPVEKDGPVLRQSDRLVKLVNRIDLRAIRRNHNPILQDLHSPLINLLVAAPRPVKTHGDPGYLVELISRQRTRKLVLG